MADESNAAASQADGAADTTAQAAPTTTTTPTTTTSSDPQAGAGTGDGKPSRSAEDYERMIAELRKENAGHRTRLKKFEDEEKARNEAQLSEQQKLEKRYAELQKGHEDYRLNVQERITSTEIRAAAADLGFADLSDAVRLLDRSELEFDEDGTPTNAKALLEKLAKAKPYLLKASGQARLASSGGATNPPRSQSNAPAELSWEVIGKMTPAEYTARSAEIKEWIAAHPHRFGQRTR